MSVARTLTVVALIASVASSAAAQEPASEPDPPEEGPVLGTRPNTPLLFSGALIGGLSYGAPLAISATYFSLIWPFQAAFGNPKPPAIFAYMLLPLVGPILAANTEFSKENPGVRTAFYVDSGLQFIGLGLIVSSLIFREEVRVKSSRLLLSPGPGDSGLSMGFTW